jgi:sialic acid synthase SpsE/sugar phosphate isomerase/epimerase
MYIDRNLEQFVVHAESSLLEALSKLKETKGRILVIVNSHDKVLGVLTNGDIIRWLIKHNQADLNIEVSTVANTAFQKVSDGYNRQELNEILKRVAFVPLLDEFDHLIGVIRREKPAEGVRIEDRIIGDGQACFVIAEIGNNHNGDITLAKHLVDEAKKAGADCAKFQMRDLSALYVNKGIVNDASDNLGTQYTLDLLSKFQLSNEELIEVFDYCKSQDIIPLCTPWDIPSLNILEDYGMPAYKVASADFTNHELLRAMASTGKTMICSTGMTTSEEIEKTVALLSELGTPYVLLHCNSTYPAPFQDINLNYMLKIKEIGNCPIGYSGHERGINVSIGAVALGANVIERHITIDRTMEGNDHKASLLPEEFGNMIKGIRQVELSLGSAGDRKMSQGEMMNRVNLAKSLIIKNDLKEGELITEEMLDVKAPGKGLQPIYAEELIGKRAKRNFLEGDFFYPTDIYEDSVSSRAYHFDFPWGIPVRYHDFKELGTATNLDFVEFHLSYKDMELDLSDFFNSKSELGYVVHSPELFANDHTLDLCSTDPDYRARSIKELSKVIEITKALRPYFTMTEKPMIVTNVGGFTDNGFLSKKERDKRYHILEESLSKLDLSEVEIIPQTMPPFPWHFGGQQYHNLFVDADETKDFCVRNNMRICLDISHSKLACAHYNYSFYEFLEKTLPYTAHMHLADSEGTGGEGLQIGEGEIDFPMFAKKAIELAPTAWFIPEIWQGHENNGEGFWVALEKLEKLLNKQNN